MNLNPDPNFVPLTEKLLKECMPFAKDENVKKFVVPLNNAMERYMIDTARREAAFLAQVAHESGSLRYVEEIASGESYEGREDLGNDQPGDGVRFKGRGLIQITGRFNYDALSSALNYDFIKEPEKLELPGAAALSAGWYWWLKDLSRLADVDAFKKITQKINGGLNGYPDRIQHWERCKKALKVVS
jgi:putative chitinase